MVDGFYRRLIVGGRPSKVALIAAGSLRIPNQNVMHPYQSKSEFRN